MRRGNKRRMLAVGALAFVAALAPVSLRGAVIRGVVVENLTNKPLMRALVTLQPIAGTPGDTRSMRASATGGFAFDRLAAGMYLLSASRRGFMPAQYGQKRWNSAGAPIVLEEDKAQFLHVRMRRYGAISGAVVDENEVGLPDHEVGVYRMRTPPELIKTIRTDDRGAYRLYGLEPGTYTVRTLGKQYDAIGYLPTFPRETAELRQARTVDLIAEQDVNSVDVRPLTGRLFTLTVSVLTGGAMATLTMASDLGRTTLQTNYFRATGLPPGDYELYAEAPDETVASGIDAAYTRVTLQKDADVGLQLLPVRESQVMITGGQREDSKVWIRRKDLAGVGQATAVEANGRVAIAPGRWEVMLQPPAGYYVSSFYGPGMYHFDRGRVDGWNEILASTNAGMAFRMAGGPGSLRGVVRSSGNAVAGAPVYLEAWDKSSQKRVGDLRSTRTDRNGGYQFSELTPGTYHVLGTFEYLNPDVETMGAAAQEVTVDPHTETATDLELYLIQ